MVITTHRLDVEEQLVDAGLPEFEAGLPEINAVLPEIEDRPRDRNGHCWDGQICDHPDHGADGMMHFIR